MKNWIGNASVRKCNIRSSDAEPLIENRAVKIGQYLMDVLSIGPNDIVHFENEGGHIVVKKV